MPSSPLRAPAAIGGKAPHLHEPAYVMPSSDRHRGRWGTVEVGQAEGHSENFWAGSGTCQTASPRHSFALSVVPNRKQPPVCRPHSPSNMPNVPHVTLPTEQIVNMLEQARVQGMTPDASGLLFSYYKQVRRSRVEMNDINAMRPWIAPFLKARLSKHVSSSPHGFSVRTMLPLPYEPANLCRHLPKAFLAKPSCPRFGARKRRRSTT